MKNILHNIMTAPVYDCYFFPHFYVTPQRIVKICFCFISPGSFGPLLASYWYVTL